MHRIPLALLFCLLPACRSQQGEPLVRDILTDDVELTSRLERLAGELDARREELHIPGMALAVVYRDEVVFARGFGVADLESGDPVTASSLFAVGSTTKAMTAAVVATLVDEQIVGWDDPVTRYLPYFTLDIDADEADAEVTVRDLLAHRTGFTRMSVLFASGDVGREDVLRTAAAAEPWAGFREEFLYNNVQYLAAGVLAGEAAESSWEGLMRARLIEPLGMNSTTLSIDGVADDPRLVQGYLWDEDREEWDHLAMRDLGNIGPAGSVNSNVLDMAEWLRLMLGEGVYGDDRLISSEQVQELWSQQIVIAPTVGYGMGWMLQEWEGRKVVEHGGNIDGFAAQVALLPEEELGFVLLTNVSFTPLQQMSLPMVWEAMLGEDEEPGAEEGEGAEPAEGQSYEPYVGRYVANFGAFDDERIEVLVKDGHLAVDVPGQMVYELREPDDEGKWYFALTDTIALSFDVEDGRANVMTFHQSGLDLECPREGWEYPAEIPLDELERFLGRYEASMHDGDFEVVIRNNHLGVDIPHQMVMELLPPDDDGYRVARIADRLRVRFNETDGRVSSLTFVDGEAVFECPRLDVENAPPSLAELHALRGSEARQGALEAAGIVRMRGTARFAQSGVEGAQTVSFAARDLARADIDLGRFGGIHSAADGERAWARSSFEPFRELTGDSLAQQLHAHPSVLLGDWRHHFEGEEVLGLGELEGRPVIELRLTDGELPAARVDIDAATGDILRWREPSITPGVGLLPITTTLADYREVEGMRIPFHSEIANAASGRLVVRLDEVETSVEMTPEEFRLQAD
ncbi:MAG: serine hydrolase domain-containing protein [Planctomycetota bacterium]